MGQPSEAAAFSFSPEGSSSLLLRFLCPDSIVVDRDRLLAERRDRPFGHTLPMEAWRVTSGRIARLIPCPHGDESPFRCTLLYSSIQNRMSKTRACRSSR